MSRRPVDAEQEPLAAAGRGRLDPEGGVLAVRDESQPRIDEWVGIERSGGEPPQACHLCTVGEHGAEGARTPDLVAASHALFQLSYSPREPAIGP